MTRLICQWPGFEMVELEIFFTLRQTLSGSNSCRQAEKKSRVLLKEPKISRGQIGYPIRKGYGNLGRALNAFNSAICTQREAVEEAGLYFMFTSSVSSDFKPR